jgi:K+-sensing histidine kinase KdpD
MVLRQTAPDPTLLQKMQQEERRARSRLLAGASAGDRKNYAMLTRLARAETGVTTCW